jgi:hypothetical protein
MCGEELEMHHTPRPTLPSYRSCRPRPLQRRPLSVRYSSPVSRLGRWEPARNADGCDSTRSALPSPYITSAIPLQRYTCLLLCIWGRRHEASFPCLSGHSRGDKSCEGGTPEAWVAAIERDLWRPCFHRLWVVPRTSHRVPCVAPFCAQQQRAVVTKMFSGRGLAGERTTGNGRWQQGLSMARGVGSCQAGPSFVGVLAFNFSCIISVPGGSSGRSKLNTSHQSSHKKLRFCNLQGKLTAS